VYSSPLPSYLVPLIPKYLPQHPVLEHPQPMFSLSVRGKASYSYETRGKITVTYILIFLFLDGELEDRIFCTERFCSQFLHNLTFDLLELFPNIWNVSPYERFVDYLYVVIFSCVLVSRHDHVHSFLDIYF
jgi:hypothetical protein